MTLENFTVFPAADLHFASGLNVIVGENGCGKTHLLKVAYALMMESVSQGKNIVKDKFKTEEYLEHSYQEKLQNTFRVGDIGELHRKVQHIEDDASQMKISLQFENNKLDLSLHYGFAYTGPGSVFPSEEKHDALLSSHYPTAWNKRLPVFMPTRELLTIYPGFVSIYDNHYLEFDETYRDTCVLLGAPALKVKGEREKKVKAMLKPLEEAMGGKVLLENGRFYLRMPDKGKIEMPMVAEGQRKLAMLAQLIATGMLLHQGYLFWDEPEANLNPKLIKLVAKVILGLCHNGIQVFIASHSLFLLRELAILTEEQAFKSVSQRYFALRIEEDGVMVEQGDAIDDLQTLILLDEELSQSDRFMQIGD